MLFLNMDMGASPFTQKAPIVNEYIGLLKLYLLHNFCSYGNKKNEIMHLSCTFLNSHSYNNNIIVSCDTILQAK